MTLTIDYQLTGVGWVDCTVQADGRQCKLTASYLSDALGKLVLAAAAVMADSRSISIGFDEEPGEYRWSIFCTNAGEVRVSILSFEDLWGDLPDADGTPILSFSCAPLDFGKAVHEAAEAVLRKHGSVDYKKQWGFDFPFKELDLLRSHIATWKRNER